MKTIKIGRKPDNDIIINDETRTVSGYHALMKVYDNGTVTICDCSTNGTFINGVKATKDVDVPIKKGDEIRLGPHVLLDWSSVDIPSPHLEATEIDTADKASYTIGTESNNRIVIFDSTNHVSRHHAELKLKYDGKYYIYDQSTNGTYVNGVKIKSKVDYPVSITDTVSFAQLSLLDWSKIIKIPQVVNSPKPVAESSPRGYTPPTKGNSGIISTIITIAIVALVIGYNYFNKNKSETIPSNQSIKREDSQPIKSQPTVPQITQTPSIQNPTTDISNLYERNKDAVFVVYTSDGSNNAQGSGFFISSSGVAVSNYHVFKGTQRGLESIKTQNGTFKVETVLASSEDNDYIVFKVAGNGISFPCLKIAGSLPRVGEDVFAIGAPEGLEQTLSKGIVSALRAVNDQTLIQTTTEITHGSSGGPLFNMRGEVIGITSGGMDAADLNFAVSIVGKGFEKY
jgi:serine protease Do